MSITKRKNKDSSIRFEAELEIRGRSHYQSFASYGEANKWINESRFRRDKGIEIAAKKITAKMLFDNFLAFAKLKCAPSYIKKVRGQFKNYIAPFYDSSIDMREVEISEHTEMLAALMVEKDDKPALKNATVNRVRALLSAMYNTALIKRSFGGAIKENPITAIDKLDEEYQRKQGLYWHSVKVIDQFMTSEKERGSHYYPLWAFLLNTGTRIGEALGVHGSQINQDRNTVIIDRQFCCSENKVVPYTKGKRQRLIGLNSLLQEVVYPLADVSAESPIFCRPDGSPLTTFYLDQYVLQEACKSAEVPYIGAHGFRRTFGSHWVMSGRSMWDLQKILGHADISTTEKHYANCSNDHVSYRSTSFILGPVELPGNVEPAKFREGTGVSPGVKHRELNAKAS